MCIFSWKNDEKIAMLARDSLRRQFRIQTYTGPVPLKYGKLATKCLWICRFFLRCIVLAACVMALDLTPPRRKRKLHSTRVHVSPISASKNSPDVVRWCVASPTSHSLQHRATSCAVYQQYRDMLHRRVYLTQYVIQSKSATLP